MKNISYCILLFFIVILTSCSSFYQGDLVETEETITPQLVAYCFIEAEDTVIQVNLSKAQPFGTPLEMEDTTLLQANISLYQNGQLLMPIPLGNIDLWNRKTTYRKEFNQPFLVNHTEQAIYELEINSLNFGTLKATQKLPRLIPIDTFDYEESAILNQSLEDLDRFSVTFTDPIGEENYYWIDLGPNPSQVFDPLLEVETDMIIFSDKNFNGQTYTVDVFSTTYKANPELEIIKPYKLRHITKDVYLYLKSSQKNEDANNNPLAQPVLLHHNMDNQLGIFGMVQTHTRMVKIR